MLEQTITKLIALYREDLIDYQELLGKMSGFKDFLENCREKDGEDAPGINQNYNSEKDISPNAAVSINFEDNLEQELTSFSLYRETIFNRLKERAFHTNELKSAIAEEEITDQLKYLARDVSDKMSEVLKLDEQIIPRLKMELESVKLELHRLQGAKRTKNAYENQGQREARFIDKTK